MAEFSIAELASALGLPTEVGKAYVGEALELRHRLPRTWARVTAGDLPAWRARRIARSTIALSREAAAYVDAKVAPFAHKIRPTALDRVIEAAIARHMPDEAEARQQASADARHLDIDTRQTGLSGTATVYGTLDLADALDLEAAVADSPASSRTSGPRTRSTCGARSRSARSPGASSPSTSAPTPPGQAVPVATPRSTSTSPRKPWPAPAASAGSRTSTSRSSSSRSAPGAATPAGSPSSRSSTSRPVPRRLLRHPRPHGRAGRSQGSALRLPLVHPPRQALRPRPRHPPPRRTHLRLQPRAPVPTTPPPQDPRPLALPRPRPRHLPVEIPHGYRYLVDHTGTADVSADRPRRQRER